MESSPEYGLASANFAKQSLVFPSNLILYSIQGCDVYSLLVKGKAHANWF